MKNAHIERNGFLRILEQKEADLISELRSRDHIAIERSADQMDELQLASERDLAIRNLDNESVMLRHVRAALQRIRSGDFGNCITCEQAIGPKRLAAVPWAPRCIRCQEAADREGESQTDPIKTLIHASWISGTPTVEGGLLPDSDVQERHEGKLRVKAAPGFEIVRADTVRW